MMHAITTWLARTLQAAKVWGFRQFYRFSSPRSWRGQIGATPFTDLQVPTGDGTIGARLYPNSLGSTKPLIVYIHGGGWVIGDLASHHPFCQALGEASGCSVIALDYRLAPEHPFPAGPNDCLAATRWIAGQCALLGPNNGQLVIAGDSAGGNIATCTCLEIDAGTRQKIIGELLIYPATDHYSAGFASYVEKARGQLLTAAVVTWFWDTYLDGLSPADPAVQRAFPRRSAALASLPPTLLVTAENDPLRDEGRAYAEQLRSAGVAVMFHHFGDAAHGFACSEGRSADCQEFLHQVRAWLGALE